jgi:stearoyl-CoA desaturase (Delta-9 desaturase)
VFSDREGDPHSPVVFGLRKVVLQGYELYVAATADEKLVDQYGRGTPDDWLERNVYGRFPVLGIVILSATQLVLFGVPAIAMIGALLIAQPFFAGGIINGVGHWFGYRSFEMPSTATNIVPVGLLLGGEELHNNHHAFPRSAKFSVQPWEFDIGWLWIRLFHAVGLARVKYVARRPRLEAGRVAPDDSSVQALFMHRMHVLRDYARRVVEPVWQDVQRHESTELPAGLRGLPLRHPDLLGPEAHARLAELLARYPALRAVVEFRERLQALWSGPAGQPEAAVQQLRDWCAEAEASGIAALREFAARVGQYIAVPVRSR